MNTTQTNTPPFGIRDKIGYMAGDLGNNMTFQLASTFLMVFYTEVLFIDPGAVATLFLVSRILDAFTDVGMGIIVDRTPATKDGKFLPWIKRIGLIVAFASFLMYQTSLADASMTVKMVYMYVTYILWGSFAYTAINIPYGSMASAITPDPDERTELSVWRTRGSMIGIMLIGVLTPMIIYTTNEAGQQVIREGSPFTWAAGLYSILAVIAYYVTAKFTTERVEFTKDMSNEPKISLWETLTELFKSRSLIAITVSSIFLLMTMILMSTMYNYVFPNFYNSSRALSTINFINPILTLFLVTPIASKLGQSIGKKEASVLGMLVGAGLNLILFLLRPESLTVFIVLSALAYSAMNIFNALVWAMITDVIDDHEIQNGQRDDGTIYAVNSFARKVGQAFAGGLGGYALAAIGYVSGAQQQTQEVLNGIFNTATLAPAIGFFVTALSIWFLYPLDKETTLANQKILKDRQ